MDLEHVEELLRRVRSGVLEPAEAARELRRLRTAEVDGVARLDRERALRCGFPEVVFGLGKEPRDLVRIVERLGETAPRVLVTRVAPLGANALRERFPEGVWHERARAFVLASGPPPPELGRVAVVCAGTSDAPVAEEARVSAEALGCRVETFYDCGVAGLHRLLEVLERIRSAHVAIAVAGMEGALPSVLTGLLDRPVIAVPTSVGYGAAFDGLAALLTMINSCAAGVTVVNIDNGFGAAYAAAQILRTARAEKNEPT
ncbi:MAG: nickel pincer cofactor biosynthesis protein LarB [Planctomycetes bacterium]|nr:nickel pincer cofactor biosynthesis protein LarB [Planctomycetota bacterium]